MRLTFNPSSDFDAVVLQDGRLVYSAWQHVGNYFWPRGNVALMLINADGTNIDAAVANSESPARQLIASRGSEAWRLN